MAHCSVDRLSRLSDAAAGQARSHLAKLPALGRRGLVGWLQTVDGLLRVVAELGLVYGSHAWQRCSLSLGVLPACWGLVIGGQRSPWETVWKALTLASRKQPSLARQ